MTKVSDKHLLLLIIAMVIACITLMYSQADADTYYTDAILIKLERQQDRLLKAFDKIGCNEYPDSLGCQLRAKPIEALQVKIDKRLKEIGE